MSRTRQPVLVSAHRGGAGDDVALENTRVALTGALTLGVDLVETDVRRLGDGTFVLFHDEHVVVGGREHAVDELTWDQFLGTGEHVLRFDDVLEALGESVLLHLDPKLSDGGDVLAVTQRAHAVLGDDRVVVTIKNAEHVRLVREWVRASGAGVLVALTLGTGLGDDRPWGEKLRTLRTELFPGRRLRSSDAQAIAANHGLARIRLARVARRRGLPLLVWTVDADWNLRYWLRPGRAWAVTTNHPDLALQMREGTAPSRLEQ